MNTETKQICSKCRAKKLWQHFSKNRTTPTGYQRICKRCNAEAYLLKLAKAKEELESAEGVPMVRI